MRGMYFGVWLPCQTSHKLGTPIASPYVSMSQQYMKQVNQIWYQIYQVVKENCSVEWQGSTPQDDVMERLLRARNGGM